MKKLAFVADVPGWAFDRTGQALKKYGKTDDYEWDVFTVNPYTIPTEGFAGYDAVRVGGIPLFMDLANRRLLNARKFWPTVASFMDLAVHGAAFAYYRPFVAGIIINDQRFRVDAMTYDRPVIYSPDKVDHEVFCPAPTTMRKPGPVRVGWTGSDTHWKNVKRVSELRAIVKRTGAIWVEHNRDDTGIVSPEKMNRWYNDDIDIYACANTENTCTPVPILECLACCRPVVTTRCGELDGLLSVYTLCDDLSQFERALNVYVNNVEAFAALQAEAVSLLPRWFRVITWEGSQEARHTTDAMLRLMESNGGRA